MKLICAIVRDIDGDEVVHVLIAHGHRVTRLASTGGFLRRGNVTLLVGVEEEHLADAIEQIRSACSPAESGQHGAVIFILPLHHSGQI